MLYNYPFEATQDNWLHDCLCEILSLIHASIHSGAELPSWPDFIPLDYRARLQRKTGLKKRIETYIQLVREISYDDREKIINSVIQQNEIELLLSCGCDCDSINDLPSVMQRSILDLFEFSYKLLEPLGIRGKHYEIIYRKSSSKTCPFCGFEKFDAPGAPREYLDHYLAKSIYPFAAANLKNLVPMGGRCNSKYKLAQDILRKANGDRRRSFNPYGGTSVEVSLLNSSIPDDSNKPIPEWKIEFSPESEEVETWDEVFDIRCRYKRDVLDAYYENWLDEFSSWCRLSRSDIKTDAQLVDEIERFSEYQAEMGIQDSSFLKAAVFNMHAQKCRDGNERLLLRLRMLADVARPVSAKSSDERVSQSLDPTHQQRKQAAVQTKATQKRKPNKARTAKAPTKAEANKNKKTAPDSHTEQQLSLLDPSASS